MTAVWRGNRGARWRAAAAVLAAVLLAGCGGVPARGTAAGAGDEGQRGRTNLPGPFDLSGRAGLVAHATMVKELAALLDRQAGAISAGDWAFLWELHPAAARARCPGTTFAEYVKSSEEYFAPFRRPEAPRLEARILSVRPRDDVALVSYVLMQGGTVVARVTDDNAAAYSYLDGRWYNAAPLC